MAQMMLPDSDVQPLPWDGPFEYIRCSKALTKSNTGRREWSLNPYKGCEHGCVYCFAPGYLHTGIEGWRVVKVKTNIADRLAKEIDSTEGPIGLGTVTDAYQAAEGRFMLSRRCLEIIKAKRRKVFVITKSPLVLRDMDLLRAMDSSVSVSITNVDPRACKMTEPGAPSVEERLRTVRTLIENGIETTVFIMPIMSLLEGHETELIDRIADAGVTKVFLSQYHPMGPPDQDRMRAMGIGPSRKAEAEIRRLCRAKGIDAE